MQSDSDSRKMQLLKFAADGCVVTAGVFSALMGLAFLLYWADVVPMGEPNGSGLALVLSTFSWLLQVGGFFAGPILAWRLTGHRFDKASAIGFVAGYAVGGALVQPVAMLGALIDWFVGLFTNIDFVGALGYLAFVTLVFVVALVWAARRSFKDLLAEPHRSMALDVTRLASIAVIAVFMGVVIVKMIQGEDALEAGVFVLLAGAQGAAALVAGDIIAKLVADRMDATQVSAG